MMGSVRNIIACEQGISVVTRVKRGIKKGD
jgi:hypothetical protein